MIKEYRTDPDIEYRNNPDGGSSVEYLTWHHRVAVDLRYVTTATPYIAGSTCIGVVGRISTFAIDVEYEVFVRDWQSVKR
jgi:hypothetical protein